MGSNHSLVSILKEGTNRTYHNENGGADSGLLLLFFISTFWKDIHEHRSNDNKARCQNPWRCALHARCA